MDTQWRHKSKKSENYGRCGRQNMLRPYLKFWEWEWIFGRAVKAISSPGVRSPCITPFDVVVLTFLVISDHRSIFARKLFLLNHKVNVLCFCGLTNICNQNWREQCIFTKKNLAWDGEGFCEIKTNCKSSLSWRNRLLCRHLFVLWN